MQKPIDPLLIDARGLRCPWPVLRAAKAFRERPDADIVIVADDPIAATELAAFAREHALRLEGVETPIGTGIRLAPDRSKAQ